MVFDISIGWDLAPGLEFSGLARPSLGGILFAGKHYFYFENNIDFWSQTENNIIEDY